MRPPGRPAVVPCRYGFGLACLALLVSCAGPVVAEGLFVGLFGDSRARRVGDTLHLLIVETSSAKMNNSQDTKQNSTTSLGPGLGELAFFPEYGISGSTSSSAAGTTTRSGAVTARMTVQVVEVTPAGNLLVEGKRTVLVNRDREEITVRGEVRPQSVRTDNSIYSYDLANVQLLFCGSDPRRPRHKVGFITRILNYFF